MKKYEIVKLYDGYAVREEVKKAWYIPKPRDIDYFGCPDEVYDDTYEQTWSDSNPGYIKKYCIFKTVEDAETFIQSKLKLETDKTPEVVKTVW